MKVNSYCILCKQGYFHYLSPSIENYQVLKIGLQKVWNGKRGGSVLEQWNHLRILKNADFFAFGLYGIVEKNIEKYMDNTKICQKWFWLNSYLNEKLPELRKPSGETQ